MLKKVGVCFFYMFGFDLLWLDKLEVANVYNIRVCVFEDLISGNQISWTFYDILINDLNKPEVWYISEQSWFKF